MDKDTLIFFAKFIQEQTGIAYSEATFYQLQARLENIARQLGLAGVSEMAMQARASGIGHRMRELLIDVSTNNETSFFRDPNVFNALAATILPNLAKQATSRPVRIWSAASSTGQEIYSIAMITEELRSTYPTTMWEFLATDISERVLSRVESGKYSDLETNRGLSDARRSQFFEKIQDQGDGLVWQVKQSLRRMVRFQRLNLIEPWPPTIGTFDLILCRNVLIYQEIEQKKKVVDRFRSHLDPKGILILGGAESLFGLSEAFDQAQFDACIAYKLKN